MNKPKNKKQKAWIAVFLKSHLNATVIQTYDATCGYYYFWFQWQENVDLPKYFCYDSGCAYYLHRTYLELTPSAIARNVKDEISQTFYPRCSYTFPKIHAPGQISLGEPDYPMPASRQKPNVRFFKKKLKRRYRRKTFGQLDLPVLGLAAKLHEIRIAKGESIKSSQALLAEKVEWQSLDTDELIYVPQAFVDMLQQMKATLKEQLAAERMLLIIGEIGALNYIESIPNWRKFNL